MNGSTEALTQLQRAATNLTESEVPGLSPVIYTTLDPSLIPSPDVLDVMTATSSRPSSVVRVMLAVYCLAVIAQNPHVWPTTLVDLCPRVHAWMDFFSDFECVLALSRTERTSWVLSLSQALMGFWTLSPETYEVVESTSGVRRAIAAGWTRLMQPHAPNHVYDVLAGISSPLLALNEIESEHHVAELLEGCGGSAKSLLASLTKTISLATTSTNPQIAATVITPVLTILARIKVHSPDLSRQFLAHGVIPFLVSALAIEGHPPVDRHSYPDFPVGVHVAPCTLVGYLELITSSKWMLQAVHAGLLERIIAWGEKLGPAPSNPRVVPHILRVVLPRILTAFTQSVLYPSWMALKSAVDRHISIMKVWEVDRAHSTLACDNLQCQKVDKRRCFSRCSGSKTAAYCSWTCQRVDWMAGHRDECSIGLLLRQDPVSSGFRFRDKSFIRALLHSTYKTHRLEIALKIIEFLPAQPNTLFVVSYIYNYTPSSSIEIHTPVVITVQALKNLSEPMTSVYWPRLARGRGLLSLHAVTLSHDSATDAVHLFLSVLRTASSRLFDGLVRVAAEAPGASGLELENVVRRLIAATEGENEHFC
ncbi:hypothetical protein FB45DRAFT_1064191 [Roridomyces roridus]|uniref:MYND-type domain-containing protein n=1 Tax=Roridomyces roridus TaxID=1738132 RepID=A0AAD7BB24_9AGAR|nr:hypothetical protein FB45DRAFT_1064191 [Roridomyces roridus]